MKMRLKTVELGDGDYVNIQPNIKHWLKGILILT